jgi:hypothetical protein
MRRILAIAVLSLAVVGAGSFAYAESQPADPSVPSDAQTQPAPRAGGRAGAQRQGPMKGAIHGELLLWERAGTTREVVFDRGRLVSVSESTITIERRDGQTVSAAVTPETKFTGTPRDQLQAGAPLLVVQDSDGNALRVLSRGPRPGAPKPRPARP